MKKLASALLKKIVITVTTAVVLVSTVTSCGLFEGDPNDRNVTYEISEDKKSVTFYATADSRAFSKWSFRLEDGSILKVEKNDWEDDGMMRVCDSRVLTGLSQGTTYVAFYIPSSKQEYTIIFGYNVTVDALGQISVEVAESDSQLGHESEA